MNTTRANELKNLLEQIFSISGYETKIFVEDFYPNDEDPEKHKSVEIEVKCYRSSDIRATCNLIDGVGILSGYCSNAAILANGEADNIIDVIGSIW